MAGLKIFGDAPQDDGKSSRDELDSIVGRFRSGYQMDGHAIALQKWRVTTNDPVVAKTVHAAYGGQEPQGWHTKGEDSLETFTDARKVCVILEGADSIRQRLVLRGRNKPIYVTDGETKDDGMPDPDAGLPLQKRKEKAYNGIGPEPWIEFYFRLADNPPLGVFKFASASWSLLRDLHFSHVTDDLEDLAADHGKNFKVLATLGLEEVSFVADGGPRAGQTVSFTKPTIRLEDVVE